jgi:hypothetical protein
MFFFCFGTVGKICSGDMYSEDTPVLGVIHVESFNVFINICHNSRRLFVLCDFMHPIWF